MKTAFYRSLSIYIFFTLLNLYIPAYKDPILLVPRVVIIYTSFTVYEGTINTCMIATGL